MNFVVRSADVVVGDAAEVTGSLYVGSARVDAGGRLLVGLRGLVYSNTRVVGFNPSRYAEEYATSATDVPADRGGRRRRAWDSDEGRATKQDDVSQTREPLTYERYLDVESRRTHSFRETSDSPTRVRKTGMGGRPGGGGITGRFDKVYLVAEEVQSLRCPIIDTTGAMVLLHRSPNGTLERQTRFLKKTNDYQWTPIHQSPDPLRNPFPFSSARTALGGTTASTATEDSWSTSPFGMRLPKMSYNTTVGDFVTLGTVTATNAGLVWVFGNYVGTALLVDDGADFHMHCGQVLTNITHSTLVGSICVDCRT